jgi:hypothetical protein
MLNLILQERWIIIKLHLLNFKLMDEYIGKRKKKNPNDKHSGCDRVFVRWQLYFQYFTASKSTTADASFIRRNGSEMMSRTATIMANNNSIKFFIVCILIL